jgi:hypothetical protein
LEICASTKKKNLRFGEGALPGGGGCPVAAFMAD